MAGEPLPIEGTELLRPRQRRPRPFAGLQANAWLREYGLVALTLSSVLLLGLVLRLTNVDWDHGQHLHPDERFLSIITSEIKGPSSIGEYFDSAKSPLNPYNHNDTFVYGTFPIFLNKAVATWLAPRPDGSSYWTADLLFAVLKPFGVNARHANGSPIFDAGYDSNTVGRVLSALADVCTIALLFELGRVLYDRRVGLLAAALLSLTVLHIQYSHFFGAETWLALFVTATLYFSVRIVKYGSGWNYAFAGIAYGLALATKLSALPAIGLPGLAILLRLWQPAQALYANVVLPRSAARPAFRWSSLFKPLELFLLLIVMTFLVFRIAEPYAFNGPGFFDVFAIHLDLKKDVFNFHALTHLAFLDPSHYLNLATKYKNDIAGLRNEQSGADFPPNVQWINRPFLIFPLRNMVLWGMGVPLAFAVGGGVLYALYRMVRQHDLRGLLPIVWAGVFFLFIAHGFNPTMRYFIPIYPALVLLAAFGLVSLLDYARSDRLRALSWRRWTLSERWLRPGLTGLVALAVGGTALWALAFLGVYTQDISRVQASYWIAKNIPAGSKLTYNEWDDAIPLGLPGINTQSYTIVPLQPYSAVDAAGVGKLITGLDQTDYVIETSNREYGSIPRYPAKYPSMVLYYDHLFDGSLGFQQVAQFTNYPNIAGIQIPDQSAEEAFTVYDHPKVTIWRKTAAYSHAQAEALLQPDKSIDTVKLPPGQAARNGLLLRPADLVAQQAGGTWTSVFSDGFVVRHFPTLLWLLVLEAAAFAATPLAFLLLRRLPDRGYLLAKPLGVVLLAYPVWLIVSLKLVHYERTTILGWLLVLLLGGAALAYSLRNELPAWLRTHWRLVLVSEALFLLAFFFFRELRLDNPDLWHPVRGGEKPMDLAYLTAVTRSTTLPPYDPWFAGGYINYYYLGQFFTATLSKATMIPPEIAFNLAVPTFFALTAAGAFSVSYNLAAAARGLYRRAPGFRPLPAWSPYAAALLGAVFVVLIGNLDGVGEMTTRLAAVSPYHFKAYVPVVGPVVNSLGGLYEVFVHGKSLTEFDYWRPSRMMPPTISITEFPYFSFLFADLHAHMMAMPFQVLAIGVSLSLVLGRRGEKRTWHDWVTIALLGLIVGSLRWINSWDYPPFLLLALAAVLIGERQAEGGALPTLRRCVAKALLLGLASYALYEPFLKNYASPVSGLHASPDVTPIHQYLAHFGIFATAIGIWLVVQLVRATKPTALRQALSTPLLEQTPRSRNTLFLILVVGFLACACDLLILAGGHWLIALLLPVLAAFIALGLRELSLRRADGGLRLFVFSLAGLALGLSIGVDLVTINGDIERMNTVFKFYEHAWILFALVAAFATWHLLFVVWRPTLAARPHFPRVSVTLAKVALAALVLGGLIYPVFATPARLADRFDTNIPPTLDGMAYMPVSTYDDAKGKITLLYDYEGIQWMRANVKGSPPIVEGRTDLYRWGSRFSIYTGLPDVIGWDWHQEQQRGALAYMVGIRSKEVDDFYLSTDVGQAQRFLREYGVQYVIVGQVEKLYYPGAGLNKFATNLGGVLEPVYANAGLTIYHVKTDVLTNAGLTATAPVTPPQP